MNSPKIPKVIPPAYSPSSPTGAATGGRSAYEGAFSVSGSNNMSLAAAAVKKKTLIGGAA